MNRTEQKTEEARKNLIKGISYFKKNHKITEHQSKALEDVGLCIADLCRVLSKTLAEQCDFSSTSADEVLINFTSAIKDEIVGVINETLGVDLSKLAKRKEAIAKTKNNLLRSEFKCKRPWRS